MKRTTLMLCLVLIACDSPTVPERLLRDVYDFRLQTATLQTLRWPAGTTVALFVVDDVDATRAQYLRAGITHGMQVWNAAALYGETRLVRTDRVESADVVVQYTPAISPVELGQCPPGGSTAYTTFCLSDDGAHLNLFPLVTGGGGHVKFVVTVRVTAATDAENVKRLVTHELGHVLGIAQHSQKQTDLMYGGILNRDDPSPADRATLQVLYRTKPDITP